MKRILGILGAVLALAACSPIVAAGAVADALAAPPVTHANKTVLDEQIATGADLLYKGFRIAATVAIKSGKCTHTCASNVRTLNNEAYGYLGTIRRAYNAANAQGYQEAYDDLVSAVTRGMALVAQGGH
jgi:hypothetical protein